MTIKVNNNCLLRNNLIPSFNSNKNSWKNKYKGRKSYLIS